MFSFISVKETNPKVFYFMNYQSKQVEVYNENWKYQETKNLLFRPTYSINNNGVIYVTTDDQISLTR